jgi:prepilin-type N-terminal cleavage/methylation domain-containing protein
VRKRSIRQTGRSGGFSLLELLIVMAIMLVVAAMALPKISATVAAYRTRQSASQLAGLFQRARIEAVKSNQTVRVRTATIADGRQQVYVDLPSGTAGSFDAGEPVIILARKVSILTTGPGDPTAGLIAVGATWNTTDLQFNGRGLPCITSGNLCSANQQGFKYYLKGDGVFSVPNWAAVVVTPGGRIKSMMYSGSSYQ